MPQVQPGGPNGEVRILRRLAVLQPEMRSRRLVSQPVDISTRSYLRITDSFKSASHTDTCSFKEKAVGLQS